MQQDDLPRIVRQPEVLTFSGLSGTQLKAAVKAGQFPQPVRLVEGGRALGWYLHELRAWDAERQKRRGMVAGDEEQPPQLAEATKRRAEKRDIAA